MLVPPVQWVISFEVVEVVRVVVSGVILFPSKTEILESKKARVYFEPLHALTNNFEEHQTVGT